MRQRELYSVTLCKFPDTISYQLNEISFYFKTHLKFKLNKDFYKKKMFC